MKQMILTGLMLAAMLGAQETTGSQDERDATLADVVQALERIEEQITLERRAFRGDENERVEFGGAPIFPVRLLLGQSAMQNYFDQGGSYGSVPFVLYPFVNGGGGTWRWTHNDRFSIGFNYYGYGLSQLGFLKHDTGPEGPNVTVDENGDGWDDYYSYASYGINVWSLVTSYRLPIEGTPVGFYGGLQAGLGTESIGFTRSDRTSNVLANTLGIQLGDLDWERMLFVTGGWVGMDVGGDRVKLAMETGLDYHIPMGDWTPAAGMHRTDIKPAADINNYSVWFMVGPHFNY